MKTIYDLEILEELKIPSKFDKEVFVMRVPGGWMFTTIVTSAEEQHNSERVSTVFVPFVETSTHPEEANESRKGYVGSDPIVI